MSEKEITPADGLSRRDFIRTASLATLGGFALTQGARKAFAQSSGSVQPLKVGLIGCGGRGTGAMEQSVQGNDGVIIWALGDLFQDRVDSAVNKYKNHKEEKVKKAFQATPERCFTGFDAYQKVLASGVDMVILATPPGFRPIHFAAAIEAGKHVFMEKPVAVDPQGIRSVIETAKKAKAKNLAVVAGTQRRHQKSYIETIKRVHDGACGEIVGGEVYWMQGGLWVKKQTDGMSDMEWQCRNWLYFDWLSGDHIVEQHVHNLDVMCWVMGSAPVRAIGLGGRQARTAPEYGNIYDHFAIEYEFENGARINAKCCQLEGSGAHRVAERFVGTKGIVAADRSQITDLKGKQTFRFEGEQINPYVQEHIDLVNSIRAGQPLNEGEQVAMSTACAILGRMAAYTGYEIKMSWMLNASKLDLSPKKYEFGANEVNPVAIPGQTKLV